MLIIYLDSNVWFEIPLYSTVLVRKIERIRQGEKDKQRDRMIWKQNDTKKKQQKDMKTEWHKDRTIEK